MDTTWLASLQNMLGQSINTVEAEMGGATRQITMDDKGLAMIFVFGLPGYTSHRQSVPCIVAAQKVLRHMTAAGVRGTAGITTGHCFCGLVGDPKIRCEYAVMGDIVNTAARLAGGAAKRGESILCAEAVRNATPPATLASFKLVLQSAGTIRMKGKEGEARVYTPARAPSKDGIDEMPAPVAIVGRDEEMELLLGALAGSHAGLQSGATLIAVQGAAGIGKTALVDALVGRAEALAHHRKAGTKWMLLRGVGQDGSTPLLPCRAILRWLLEQQGEPEADTFSWLLGKFNVKAGLPAMLQRHAAAIEKLQLGMQDNVVQLEALYSEIIWDALQEGGIVLLLEDLDMMDEQSLEVMRAVAAKLLATELNHSGCGSQEHDDKQRPHGVLLYTARGQELLQVGKAVGVSNRSLLLDQPKGTFSLRLGPLSNDAVEQMARGRLGSSLAEDIVSMVVERSAGIPLQTVELCGWLESEELVINGQLSPKAAGLDLMGLVPPNLQTIVQAEVDQLALVPRVVLHCAAVLGVQFEALALFDMMPSDIVHNPAELQEQLEVLHDAHLIQRPAWISENVALSGANYQDYWKFCSSLHHEVVYSSMAHTHRRSLHLKAARAIEARLESVNSVLESRPLLNALTIHLLRSCRTSGRSSQGQRFREMKKSEVDWLFDALTRAAENSQAVGDYEEAVQYLTELITVLREQNEMADELEFNLLEAESLAVEALNKCFLTMTLFTVSTTPTPSSTETLQQKLAELAAGQKELQEKIKKARGSVVEVNGRNNRKKLSGFSLARRLSVAAKFTSAGLEFVTNKGFMQPETCRRILNE